MSMYRLTQKDHLRLTKVANFMCVGPDILLRKMLENSLRQFEETLDVTELTNDLSNKYKIAEAFELLEK